MKRSVVHLARVDGSLYCSASHSYHPNRSGNIERVTCLRCLRRFHRLPINAKVDPRLRGEVE